MVCLRLGRLLSLRTALVCFCFALVPLTLAENLTKPNTSTTASAGTESSAGSSNVVPTNTNTTSQAATTGAPTQLPSSNSSSEQVQGSSNDGSSSVTATGDANASTDVSAGTTAAPEMDKAESGTTAKPAIDSTDVPDASAPVAQNGTANGTANATTTPTTTTKPVWRRPTTTTTIYTPVPADATQSWMPNNDPCFVECKDPLEKVFGSGPIPSSDSATFAVKMMRSCRTMMDLLKCVREKPAECPAGGEVAQSVEFYTAMCMCPCRDAFVRGLRRAHENPEANLCVNFEDFAGCSACASQREECDYALVDTKTEVAGRLLEAASACPTASCTGYLWQWQPQSAGGAVGEAAAGADGEAGGAGRTSGAMSSVALYLLLGFWALVA